MSNGQRKTAAKILLESAEQNVVNRKPFLGTESTIYGGLTGPPQKMLYEE